MRRQYQLGKLSLIFFRHGAVDVVEIFASRKRSETIATQTDAGDLRIVAPKTKLPIDGLDVVQIQRVAEFGITEGDCAKAIYFGKKNEFTHADQLHQRNKD